VWSAEETNACFIVRDHNGQALAHIYFKKGYRTMRVELIPDEKPDEVEAAITELRRELEALTAPFIC
jgi:hypothetical protein